MQVTVYEVTFVTQSRYLLIIADLNWMILLTTDKRKRPPILSLLNNRLSEVTVLKGKVTQVVSINPENSQNCEPTRWIAL